MGPKPQINFVLNFIVVEKPLLWINMVSFWFSSGSVFSNSSGSVVLILSRKCSSFTCFQYFGVGQIIEISVKKTGRKDAKPIGFRFTILIFKQHFNLKKSYEFWDGTVIFDHFYVIVGQCLQQKTFIQGKEFQCSQQKTFMPGKDFDWMSRSQYRYRINFMKFGSWFAVFRIRDNSTQNLFGTNRNFFKIVPKQIF